MRHEVAVEAATDEAEQQQLLRQSAQAGVQRQYEYHTGASIDQVPKDTGIANECADSKGQRNETKRNRATNISFEHSTAKHTTITDVAFSFLL